MNDPVARNLERALEGARRRVDPLAEDRARISERLRAELGAEIVDGLAPAPGPARLPSPARLPGSGRVVPGPAHVVLGRNGWLAAVVGTGIVTGAIGFMLGYGLGLGARPLGAPSRLGAQVEAGAGAFPSEASSSAASPTPTLGAPTDAAIGEAARETAPPATRNEPDVRHESTPAPIKRPAPRVLTTPANEPAAPIRQPAVVPRLAFAEVVERLRRANLALGDAKPTLAIIELRELDRLAGDTLREERDMTHLLASCALGDVDEATRRARRLLASPTSSIYAPRIERSCAREGSR